MRESIQSFIEFVGKGGKDLKMYQKEVFDSIINHPESPIDNIKNIIDIIKSDDSVNGHVSLIAKSDENFGGYYIYHSNENIDDPKSWVISLFCDSVDDSLLEVLSDPTFVYDLRFYSDTNFCDLTKEEFQPIEDVLKRISNEYKVRLDCRYYDKGYLTFAAGSIEGIKNNLTRKTILADMES